MVLLKILRSLAIASTAFSTISSTVFLSNAEDLKAQVKIGASQSNALSPAQQMLVEMRQSNAPAVGGGSMQLFRFTENKMSFVPFEGLEKFFKWDIPETEVISEQTIGDRIQKFKLEQRRQIVSDSQMLEAINRINHKKSQ
jgi:hypothetical protein